MQLNPLDGDQVAAAPHADAVELVEALRIRRPLGQALLGDVVGLVQGVADVFETDPHRW